MIQEILRLWSLVSMSNTSIKNLFFKYIKQDFNTYQSYIRHGRLFDNIKLKMYDFILYTPSESNLFIDEFSLEHFNELYFENLNRAINSRLKLENKFNVYSINPLGIKEFDLIDESISKQISMIFLTKRGKHIKNLYQRIRNSLAHGNYFIKNKRIVMWSLSAKDNITFFSNISLSDFKYLHKLLIDLSQNKTTS
jgi:hypothetical protein